MQGETLTLQHQKDVKFAVVVIGRNEGERLKLCLESLPATATVIYVDSGSTDGSVEWARERSTEVIELDRNTPFTAARARNVGFKRAREIAPNVSYVQFVDGDCQISDDWFVNAISFLDSHKDFAAVCGRLRERYPSRSIYNWLCDREWDVPPGEVRTVGGIAMMRTDAVETVDGFRDDLIAGEEPELCVRLRSLGWRIWRLGVEMALHDAAIFHFGQWWLRAQRSGFCFAQGSYLHGATPEKHYTWESRRAWLWGIWLPLGCLTASLTMFPWGLTTWLIYPFQVIRQTMRNTGSLTDRLTIAFFQVLGRFPESFGQVKFLVGRMFGRKAGLIEYK